MTGLEGGQDAFRSFGQALDRLGEALERDFETDSLVVDATIQRFEFTFELGWKALKRAIETEGRVPRSPRETFTDAYALGWIDDEALWLAMMRDRNLTSHTYKEDQAREIFRHIRRYHPELRKLHHFLKARFCPEGD